MSIPVRLFVFIILPIAICLGALGVWMQGEIEQRFERRMEDEVQMVARSLQAPLVHALQRERPGSIESALDAVESIGRVFSADIYDADGTLLASTRSPRGTEDAYARFDAEFEGAPPNEALSTYEEVEGRNVYSYFVPLTSPGGTPIGFLQVTRLQADFRAFVARLRIGATIALSSALLIIALIVIVGYRGAVGRAVDELRRVIGEVGTGHREARARPSGPPELASLSRAFNGMLDAIEQAEFEIAAQRQRELDLRKKLHRSEQLAALGRLSGGIAHELGSPLTTIRGRVQRALRHDDVPEPIERSLRQIARQASRMERITTELLQFGRTRTGRRVELPLSSVVATAVEVVREQTDVSIEYTPLPDIRVEVEMARIERAVVNVLQNAVYSSTQVIVDWETDQSHVYLHVDDDGAGIDPEIRDKIFEPFFTTKPVDAGTGLGMSIVHSVMAEHDGSVTAGESPMGGARVTLALPRLDTEDR